MDGENITNNVTRFLDKKQWKYTIFVVVFQKKSRATQLFKQILREDIALWKKARQKLEKRENKIFNQPVLFFSQKLVDMVDLVDQKNGPLVYYSKAFLVLIMKKDWVIFNFLECFGSFKVRLNQNLKSTCKSRQLFYFWCI